MGAKTKKKAQRVIIPVWVDRKVWEGIRHPGPFYPGAGSIHELLAFADDAFRPIHQDGAVHSAGPVALATAIEHAAARVRRCAQRYIAEQALLQAQTKESVDEYQEAIFQDTECVPQGVEGGLCELSRHRDG